MIDVNLLGRHDERLFKIMQISKGVLHDTIKKCQENLQ
jgi:hypothetical protein